MILIIDNYDSFTYNLVQYFGELCEETEVHLNDKITLQAIEKKNPDRILISPGPCTPKESGISLEVIHHFLGKIPILGVCLGHQALAMSLGGKIVRAKTLVHGKSSSIQHDGRTIFKNCSKGFEATRYHSLAVEKDSLPKELEISAWTADGEIMGIRHKELKAEGVQFHPESILTIEGKTILSNFLEIH
jgi:anthranilate synthase/aminodeoxychorismate synthase-like glutamine amidotransferase